MRELKRFFVERFPKDSQDSVELSQREAHHARNVLRLPSGSLIEILDGRGSSQTAELIIQKKSTLVKGLENKTQIRKAHPQEVVPMHFFVGSLKSDMMEWVIEKLTELGTHSIYPVIAEFSQFKGQSRPNLLEKWQIIADQSLKQCGRLNRIEIHPPQETAKILKQVSDSYDHWVGDPKSKNTLNKITSPQKSELPIAVWIGPEGGWSPDEREHFSKYGFKTFSLGPLTLRAETASISVAAIVGSQLRNQL